MSNRLLDSVLSTEEKTQGPILMASESSLEDAEAALSVEEAAQEAEIADMTTEELVHAANSLEKIQDSIEATLEESDRGLSTESAQAYSLAIEGVFGEAIANPVASLESFGADSTRKEATETSLEGIGETIKNLWEKIKAAITKAVKAVGDFFKSLFDGAAKAKKKNEEVLSALKKKKDDDAEVTSKEIDMVSATSIANKDGEVDFKEACNTMREFYEKDVENLVSKVQIYYNQYFRDYIKYMTPDAMKEVMKDGDEEKWYSKINPLEKTIDKVDKPSVEDLPGQAKVVPLEVETMVSAKEKGKLTIGYTVESNKDAKKPTDKLETPSLDDAIAAAECVEKLLETIEKGKKTREEIVKQRKETQKEVDDAINKVTSDLKKDDEEGKKGAKAVQQVVNNAVKVGAKNLASSIQKVDNHAYKFARAMTKNLQKVESAYGKGGEKKDDE